MGCEQGRAAYGSERSGRQSAFSVQRQDALQWTSAVSRVPGVGASNPCRLIGGGSVTGQVVAGTGAHLQWIRGIGGSGQKYDESGNTRAYELDKAAWFRCTCTPPVPD